MWPHRGAGRRDPADAGRGRPAGCGGGSPTAPGPLSQPLGAPHFTPRRPRPRLCGAWNTPAAQTAPAPAPSMPPPRWPAAARLIGARCPQLAAAGGSAPRPGVRRKGSGAWVASCSRRQSPGQCGHRRTWRELWSDGATAAPREVGRGGDGGGVRRLGTRAGDRLRWTGRKRGCGGRVSGLEGWGRGLRGQWVRSWAREAEGDAGRWGGRLDQCSGRQRNGRMAGGWRSWAEGQPRSVLPLQTQAAAGAATVPGAHQASGLRPPGGGRRFHVPAVPAVQAPPREGKERRGRLPRQVRAARGPPDSLQGRGATRVEGTAATVARGVRTADPAVAGAPPRVERAPQAPPPGSPVSLPRLRPALGAPPPRQSSVGTARAPGHQVLDQAPSLQPLPFGKPAPSPPQAPPTGSKPCSSNLGTFLRPTFAPPPNHLVALAPRGGRNRCQAYPERIRKNVGWAVTLSEELQGLQPETPLWRLWGRNS